jgi:predicted regulator of Ras-like GTPase activity (Roadblock/LC7/MglB family)
MSAPVVLNQIEAALCQRQIDALIEAHGEVRGVLVSTVDGFEVAANMRGKSSPAKMAAMTSSLLALGEAVSDEGEVGNCVDMVIDATAGRVLLMDIPHATRKLLLTVLSDNASTLGQVLWAVRACRQEIGRLLGS